MSTPRLRERARVLSTEEGISFSAALKRLQRMKLETDGGNDEDFIEPGLDEFPNSQFGEMKILELPKSLTSDTEPDLTLYEPDERFWEKDGGEVTRWKGHGVPIVGKGGKMVLIALTRNKSNENDVMVSEEDFRARLRFCCEHGLKGWACKPCLNKEEIRRLI